MTQYKQMVEEYQEKMKAEEWGKEIKHIHAHNGIFEVAYNNGEIHYEENIPNGKKWVEGKALTKKSLMDKFSKFITDVRVGVDPYGK